MNLFEANWVNYEAIGSTLFTFETLLGLFFFGNRYILRSFCTQSLRSSHDPPISVSEPLSGSGREPPLFKGRRLRGLRQAFQRISLMLNEIKVGGFSFGHVKEVFEVS